MLAYDDLKKTNIGFNGAFLKSEVGVLQPGENIPLHHFLCEIAPKFLGRGVEELLDIVTNKVFMEYAAREKKNFPLSFSVGVHRVHFSSFFLTIVGFSRNSFRKP